MIKLKKICITMLIMLIIAILLVLFTTFVLRKENKTYEGTLVKEIIMEEGIDEIEYNLLES